MYKDTLLSPLCGFAPGVPWRHFFLCFPSILKNSAFRNLTFACVALFISMEYSHDAIATSCKVCRESSELLRKLRASHGDGIGLAWLGGCALPECDLLHSAACWLQGVSGSFGSCRSAAAETVTNAVFGPSLAVPLLSVFLWTWK